MRRGSNAKTQISRPNHEYEGVHTSKGSWGLASPAADTRPDPVTWEKEGLFFSVCLCGARGLSSSPAPVSPRVHHWSPETPQGYDPDGPTPHHPRTGVDLPVQSPLHGAYDNVEVPADRTHSSNFGRGSSSGHTDPDMVPSW